MLDPSQTTFIFSLNDYEAFSLWNLLARHGDKASSPWKVLPLTHAWGESTFIEKATFEALGNIVVLVEIRDPSLDTALEKAGKRVLHIDHHLYSNAGGQLEDRRNNLSSLEQVAQLISTGLNAEERAASANDRGYIPSLAAIPLPSTVDEVRLLDLAMTLATENLATTFNAIKFGDIQDCETSLDPNLLKKQKEEAASRLKKAKTALSTARRKGRMRVFRTGARPMAKPDWPETYLLLVDASHRRFMLDAVYSLAQKEDAAPDRRLEVLILYAEGLDGIKGKSAKKLPLTALEYSGSCALNPLVEALMDGDYRRKQGLDGLQIYGGSGGQGVFLVAEDRLGRGGPTLSKLADTVLDCILVGQRPVSRFTTRFIQPFQLSGGLRQSAFNHLTELLREGDVNLVRANGEERGYFHPHVSGMLTPFGLEAKPGETNLNKVLDEGHRVASFDFPIADLSLSLDLAHYPTPLRLPLTCLRLHLFFNDVCLLEWGVGDRVDRDEKIVGKAQGPLWRQYLDGWPKGTIGCGGEAFPEALSLAQVIDINAGLRYTHSAMKTDETDYQVMIRLLHHGEIIGAMCRGKDLTQSPHITGYFRSLLNLVMSGKDAVSQPVIEGSDKCSRMLSSKPHHLLTHHLDDALKEGRSRHDGDLIPLGDDRARVLASVVPAGGMPSLPGAYKRMLEPLAHLYNVDDFDVGHQYGADFAVADLESHSYGRFSEMGTHYAASSHSFIQMGFGSFNEGFLHGIHMQTMYRRMFLLSIFYAAILHSFSLDVIRDGASKKAGRASLRGGGYQDWREKLLDFTNNLFFRQVSSQVQGNELFKLICNPSPIDQEYTMVSDEIDRTEEFESARESMRAEQRNTLIARIGLPFALFLTFLSFTDATIRAVFPFWCLLEKLPFFGLPPFVPLALLSVTLGAGLPWLIHRSVSHKLSTKWSFTAALIASIVVLSLVAIYAQPCGCVASKSGC